MTFSALDKGSVLLHQCSELGGLTEDAQRVADGLRDVFLADLGSGSFDSALRVVVGVTFHVELAESLEVFNLLLELRNTLDLRLLLVVWLNLTLSHLLVKISILVHLLAEVSEGLSLGVKELIFKLGEVELNCDSFLLFGLGLLGCCLCTHFG